MAPLKGNDIIYEFNFNFDFHNEKVMAPLKAFLEEEGYPTSKNFHNEKVMAPLKGFGDFQI